MLLFVVDQGWDLSPAPAARTHPYTDAGNVCVHVGVVYSLNHFLSLLQLSTKGCSLAAGAELSDCEVMPEIGFGAL